jgi:hypothetical protein
MTKKIQKIWMWVFIAIFAIPEILWSPVLNFYYELSQTSISGGTHPFRNNFLQNSDNLKYLKFIIVIQLIGLLLTSFFLLKNKYNTNKIIKYLFVLLLVVFLIATGFALLFISSFSIDIL